jgi:diacylglycerol kinase (ATP)
MLIWNPTAGRIGTQRQVRQATRALGENGWNVRVEHSRSADHVTELAAEAAQTQLDAVFVAGGDGSLARVVAGLVGSETALGVLPTGTANVWAREIGLPVSTVNMVVKSARKLATARVRLMDVGICNGLSFLLWAGFGLDGRVVDQLERKRTRFVKQLNEVYYALSILKFAAGWQGVRVQVKADEQEIEGRYMVAVAGNIQYYAGGLAKLSPEAAWDDGRMELWLFGSGKRGGMGSAVRHLWNLGWGRHVKDGEVVCMPFQQLSLVFETEEWMQMDGDPWGKVREVDITVKKRAVRVLVPEKE